MVPIDEITKEKRRQTETRTMCTPHRQSIARDLTHSPSNSQKHAQRRRRKSVFVPKQQQPQKSSKTKTRKEKNFGLWTPYRLLPVALSCSVCVFVFVCECLSATTTIIVIITRIINNHRATFCGPCNTTAHNHNATPANVLHARR